MTLLTLLTHRAFRSAPLTPFRNVLLLTCYRTAVSRLARACALALSSLGRPLGPGPSSVFVLPGVRAGLETVAGWQRAAGWQRLRPTCRIPGVGVGVSLVVLRFSLALSRGLMSSHSSRR
jgi:hypothetical protein